MPTQYDNYKALKAKGYSAKSSLNLLKSDTFDSLYDAVLFHDGTEFEYQGFDIKVLVEADEEPMIDDLGQFSNQRGEDAIWHNRRGDRNILNYFNPTNKIADYQQGFSDAGYSKHDAYLKAKAAIQQDYQEVLNMDKVVVIVTASLEGVELGSDILGNIDRDYAEAAIVEHGMVDNAIEDAKHTLTKLQAIRLKEDRTSRHNKGFSVHYYHSDIPSNDPFIIEAVTEALVDKADIYNPIDADTIALMTEQVKQELAFELNKAGRR